MCGIADIDVEQWKTCTVYANGYTEDSEPVKLFWAVVKSWDSAMQVH